MNKEDKLTCTSCGKDKAMGRNYYMSYSNLYKGIGKIPICIDCIVDLYDKYLDKYNDEKKAVYYTCRKLDVYFDTPTFDGAKKQEQNSKTNTSLIRIYIQKTNSLNNQNKMFDDCELMYNTYHKNKTDDEEIYYGEKIDDEMKLFWGKGFEQDDYIFLETELSNWKQTHKCDNQAEITLLREICIKILEIRKSRESKSNTGNLQKELQELMKTASLDPAKANAASAGKSQDSFGVWIKDIEQFRPAEWHDKQEKYKDMDGFGAYIQNYIVRPISNFITGQRDFQINENIDVDLNDSGVEDV